MQRKDYLLELLKNCSLESVNEFRHEIISGIELYDDEQVESFIKIIETGQERGNRIKAGEYEKVAKEIEEEVIVDKENKKKGQNRYEGEVIEAEKKQLESLINKLQNIN